MWNCRWAPHLPVIFSLESTIVFPHIRFRFLLWGVLWTWQNSRLPLVESKKKKKKKSVIQNIVQPRSWTLTQIFHAQTPRQQSVYSAVESYWSLRGHNEVTEAIAVFQGHRRTNEITPSHKKTLRRAWRERRTLVENYCELKTGESVTGEILLSRSQGLKIVQCTEVLWPAGFYILNHAQD